MNGHEMQPEVRHGYFTSSRKVAATGGKCKSAFIKGPDVARAVCECVRRKAFGLDEATRELSANSGREVVKALDCR
jgi:hypothetical protein